MALWKLDPDGGRGGGLSRIGSDVPQKRKGRKVKKDIAGMCGDVRMAEEDEPEATSAGQVFGEPSMTMQQQPSPLPAPVATKPPAFEVNNFAPTVTACDKCDVRFENREALLAHRHDRHGEPASPHCSCMVCLGTFDGQNVDAAGVHAREKGAVTMRGLMADDLFGPVGGKGGEKPTTMPISHAATQSFAGTPTQGNVDNDFGVGEMLAAMGTTEAQFTANMPTNLDTLRRKQAALTPAVVDPGTEARLTASIPKPIPTTARTQSTWPLNPEAEARFTADMFGDVDQSSAGAAIPGDDAMAAAGFDDVDAWLKSAEEIFGDEGGDVDMS